jgi:hypothetical protein
MYQLTEARWRQRLADLKGHQDIKSLRDEISMLRILIEEMWNAADGSEGLVTKSSAIGNLLLTLERLIKSCHQLEQANDTLLAKTTVIVLAQNIVQIVTDELVGLPDFQGRVDRITNRLFTTIEQATNTLEAPNAEQAPEEQDGDRE